MIGSACRTAAFCEQHKDRRTWLAGRTGLVLDPYFSATKIAWLLDHVPGARGRAEDGALAAGTVDSFLLWHLTGGPSGGVHITDVTNASRTQLMNLETLAWDKELLNVFGIPEAMLPEIRSSSENYGLAKEPSVKDVAIAGRAGGTNLLRSGRGEKHLWHRLLFVDEHRHQESGFQVWLADNDGI